MQAGQWSVWLGGSFLSESNYNDLRRLNLAVAKTFHVSTELTRFAWDEPLSHTQQSAYPFQLQQRDKKTGFSYQGFYED